MYTCMFIIYTDHTLWNDHEPDIEATISAKIKSDLCKRAAENPTQPMKEVYNEYMNSADVPTLDDDIMEPQLRSCTSQMYKPDDKTCHHYL